MMGDVHNISPSTREELVEALRDTLSMLKAAHMHLNMPHDANKRVLKARQVLAKATEKANG